MSAGRGRRPNILFVNADQLRAHSLGTMGDPHAITPTFDALASGGTVFTHAYCSSPSCCPSRATMLTGMFCHAQGHGVVMNNVQLRRDSTTISALLKDAGYRTGYVGMWHLDGPQKRGYVPPGWRRRGFEYWAAYNAGLKHWDWTYFEGDGTPHFVEGYAPDRQTDLALEFIRDRGRDDTRPFCLFLAWGPPHTPLTPPESYEKLFSAEEMTLRPNVPEHEHARGREELARYNALVTSLDANMERLISCLRTEGILEDTVVCFTADHGDMLGSHGLYRKGVPFEEATRIPLIFSGAREINAGRRLDSPVTNADLMPTLLFMCGVDAPAGVHGRDLSGLITGQSTAPRLDSILVQGGFVDGSRAWRMVRSARYMYTARPDTTSTHNDVEPLYLFDMEEDPYQMTNLADSDGHARVRDEMEGVLRDWLAAVEDPFCG